jgi:hypothetical protein
LNYRREPERSEERRDLGGSVTNGGVTIAEIRTEGDNHHGWKLKAGRWKLIAN